MKLEQVLEDVAAALAAIDGCGIPFKGFQPGVGPYGEPQLLAAVVQHLNRLPDYAGSVRTKRTPDLLILGRWAREFKVANSPAGMRLD